MVTPALRALRNAFPEAKMILWGKAGMILATGENETMFTNHVSIIVLAGAFNEEFEDDYLIESLLEIMHENKTDFTITFRRLSNAVLNKEKENQLKKLFYNSINFENWFLKWQNRLSLEGKKQKEIINLMKSVNPSVIPRNHLVEKAISAAELNGDYSFLENLLKALANPFDEKDENDRYVTSPKPEEVVLKTFCGT